MRAGLASGVVSGLALAAAGGAHGFVLRAPTLALAPVSAPASAAATASAAAACVATSATQRQAGRRCSVRRRSGPSDVGNDPSGATVVPKLDPPIPPAPQGPNAKAIVALVAGELLLGLLAFPLGFAFKIQPLGSIRNAFSAAATAAVGGLGPALLNALGLSAMFTLPALILHKVSGDEIENMLRDSLQQIFGAPDSPRRKPVLLLAISLLLSLSAGLGEELLFRGALQPLVASLGRSEALGVGLSSLLFAVLHAATPRYLLLAFVLSVYLGWIQLATANLFIPIAVHTIFDVVGFMLSLFDNKKKDKKA